MQLWHDLTIAEQRRYDHIFRSIVNPITLTAEEFVLLAQWLFVSDHYTIQSIAPCVGGGHDVVLRAPDATLELLRLYHANPPFISIYSLQETARDGGYIKIRIYTLGTFTPSQLKVQNELPMLLEFRDGNKVTARVEDTRRVLQARHDRQKPKPEPPLAQFGKQALKQNTISDELRVANRQAGPSKKRPDPSDEEIVETIYRPNRAPVSITRPRRDQTFARVMLVILSSLAIIVAAVFSYTNPEIVRQIISRLFVELTPPIERTNDAISTYNAQVVQTNQAVVTLNTTVTAIKLTNDAVSTFNVQNAQTNQAIATLNTTSTAIKLTNDAINVTNDAVSTQNFRVAQTNAALSAPNIETLQAMLFTPTHPPTATRTPTRTRTPTPTKRG